MKIEQWNLIVSACTLLIAGLTFILYVRDRREVFQVSLRMGGKINRIPFSVMGEKREKVSSFEITIRNTGKPAIYFSSVQFHSDESKQKFDCTDDFLPSAATRNNKQTIYSGFELVGARKTQRNIPANEVLQGLKITNLEEASIFVTVELENGNVYHSKPLTVSPKAILLESSAE